MSDTSFDRITQELLKQQQVMEELKAENHELHRQLSDLRAGRGVFINIAGQQFPLWSEPVIPQAVTTSVQENVPATSSFSQEAPTPISSENEVVEEVATVAKHAPSKVIFVAEEESKQQQVPSFLEEIMLDEFVTAATSPMSVWTGPIQKQDPTPIDEKQKAALRRELMGSFLLE